MGLNQHCAVQTDQQLGAALAARETFCKRQGATLAAIMDS